jgi:hypothetical protein
MNIKEPYLNQGRTTNQWMLSLKVIDPSLNQKATNQIKTQNSKRSNQNGGDSVRSINHAVIQFFASEKYNLPNLVRIGDILRVQKCICREHQGNKQFNVNVYENKSEWAVFKGHSDKDDHKDDQLFVKSNADLQKGIMTKE